MIYAFPEGIYMSLVVLLIFWGGWRLYTFRQHTLRQFASPEVLASVVLPRSRFNFWAKVGAFCVVWIGATLALMQPEGNGHYPFGKGMEAMAQAKRKAHDVIFLLDASASMGVIDTRTGVTRLDYAKEIVDEIISQLQGESVALHAFTAEPTKLSPATLDYLFVRLMLRQVEINEGDIAGTDLLKALQNVRQEYFSELAPKMRTLVILTDGGEGEDGAVLDQVAQAEALNLRVFTIGLGTNEGEQIPGIPQAVVSSLNEGVLRNLARKGRGHYYFANEMTAYDLAEDLVERLGEEEAPLEGLQFSKMTLGKEDLIFDPYFQFPLGIALLFLIFALFFPDTRKKLIMILPFCVVFPLMGQPEVYYEAEEYDKAIERYEGLEKERLEPWQLNRVKYNLATTYLAAGYYEKALQKMEEIKNPSPFLRNRIGMNRAIANFRQAKKVMDKDYRGAIFFFRDALDRSDPELFRAAKSALAELLEHYTRFLIEQGKIKQGVPVLLSGVKTTLSHLDFLETKILNDKRKKRYLDLTVKDAKWWIPLWESQASKMGELVSAERDFIRGLELLEEEQLTKSRQAFEDSAEKLTALLQQIWGDDPLIERLQNLLISYYRTLIQVPLQEASLYRLQAEQNQVRVFSEDLEGADGNLSKSIEAVDLAKLVEGRIYAEEARQGIRRMIRKMEESTPESILEDAIEDQEHALSVNRLAQQIAELPAPVGESQEKTVKTAAQFLPVVLAVQEKNYPTACQCKPWKTVIPLFFQGLRSAKRAEVTLSSVYQEKAIEYWKRALNYLKGIEVKEEVVQEEISVKDVLRELQQMEQEDRLPRRKRVFPQEGVKPW